MATPPPDRAPHRGAVLAIEGPLCASSIREWCQVASRFVTAHRAQDVALDLGRVTMLDPAGLGMLVGLRAQATLQNRAFVLVDVPPRIRTQIDAASRRDPFRYA